MNYAFIEPWDLFLPREAGHVVAVMGSGGMTPLMQACAGRIAADGTPVVLTATRDGAPVPEVATVGPDGLAGADLPPVVQVLAAGQGGLATAAVDELGGSLADRVVLARVDGGTGRPLRIHGADRPAWPARTSLAVIVLGVDGVGSRLDSAVDGWPGNARGELAGLPGHTLVGWELVAELLLGDGGYLAQVPDVVPAVLALAGLGAQDDSIGLFGFVEKAMTSPRLPLVVFCGGAGDGAGYRTAALVEPDRARTRPDGNLRPRCGLQRGSRVVRPPIRFRKGGVPST